MKNTFKIILFSLLLNIATGIMTVAITDVNGNQVFQKQDMSRVPSYNDTTGIIKGNFAGQINPAGVTEDKGNLVFRLLDLIGLGFINKMISTLDSYMFGFINFMEIMFGKWMDTITSTVIFGLLKSLLSVGYILAAFELWTGKTLTD